MQNRKLSEDDVQKFMQGCEDLMRLGGKFTTNIRQAVEDLKKTYDPALKSQYVDKAVVELLTRSLSEFERKVESNLEAIEKICTKGGKWFAFYLGRSVEKELADLSGNGDGAKSLVVRKDSTDSGPGQRTAAKRVGTSNGS